MATPAANAVVLLIGAADAPDLRDWLASAGFDVIVRKPDDAPDGFRDYAAALLDGRADDTAAFNVCRRLSQRPAEDRCPVVFLAADQAVVSRLVAYESGADVVLQPSVTRAELVAQIHALERWQRVRSALADSAAEAQLFNQRLQQAYKQIEIDLALARRLQVSFLPQSLPAVGPIRFAINYRPCGQVGGDFYDVFRLDEQHVGFYVADAMGHGVPASLLTVFLKKVVQPKEVRGSTYRLVPPEEVLARVNRELIAQALAEQPFITMVYGLLNCHDGRLRLARAAHPHPLYLPQVGDPVEWQSAGALLGIFEAEYPPTERRLNPGDKLLVYTDGVSAGAEAGVRPDPIIAAAQEHRGLPIESFVERVSQDLAATGPQRDDCTLLGVEFLV
jgi:sigma-B regulation protein RsbU (phosphoserine phosphatase)